MDKPIRKHYGRSHRVMTGDVVAFNILGYTLLVLFALLCIIPFYLVIISSFQAESVLVTEGYPLYIKQFSI